MVLFFRFDFVLLFLFVKGKENSKRNKKGREMFQGKTQSNQRINLRNNSNSKVAFHFHKLTKKKKQIQN